MNSPNPAHRVFVVMGVSGSGKSTVATRLARELDCALIDGDYLHPRANIDKMASGQPLNDDDRAPWLTAVSDAAYAMQRTQPVSLIVCSTLKRAYRDRLRHDHPALRFIYLRGDAALIGARMAARGTHFFRPAMLASQFASLEEPQSDEADVRTIDVSGTLDEVVAAAVQLIRSGEERA
ncbi:gluconokinase, GntK/IdnK-type [Chitinibacteraceae bacterium HSL-7]